jgi:hypothetical protein
MTPEQRAAKVCVSVTEDEIRVGIANAIRKAVAAEREACAKVARTIAVKYLAVGPGTMAERFKTSPAALSADEVNKAILARSTEART